MNRAFSAILLITSLAASPTTSAAIAQTKDATDPAAIRQSAVFLEQIVGPWAQVLAKWDRDPAADDWNRARQLCDVAIVAPGAKPVADANPKPPPADMMFGGLVYYRGPDGLQQFTLATNEIRKYPELRVGAAKNGSPVYQISGQVGKLVLYIGKIASDEKPAIVLVQESGLYMRCKQD